MLYGTWIYFGEILKGFFYRIWKLIKFRSKYHEMDHTPSIIGNSIILNWEFVLGLSRIK